MVQSQNVTFPSGNTQRPAYLARPDGDGTFPGVIVIHEIFGLNENIKDIARRFASEGYVALAVDLFAERNKVICMFRVLGEQLFSSLDNASISELKAALSYLASQPGVDSNRIGAVGYCMGGGLAIAWASTDDRLHAIAPYYGANPRPLDATARACPVVGSYPDKDFTTSQGKKLDAVLTQANIPHDIKIYPNSRHSFFNDQRSAYDPPAAADSWERVLAFFGERLATPHPSNP
ncbi:MAG TPA: carboxymethylenebutenolidase [Ktedonobacter sp.]|nr:carboxymethylenebutenolidase [Ktedonobacter sp.]